MAIEKPTEWHIRALDKLFNTIKSCENVDHLEAATKMMFNYHTKYRPDKVALVLRMAEIEDYLAKKSTSVIFNQATEKLSKRYES